MSEGRVSECTHTPRKKKSHTSACVYIPAACTRQHTKTYDHQHRTHTPEQTRQKKNVHTNISKMHTPGGLRTIHIHMHMLRTIRILMHMLRTIHIHLQMLRTIHRAKRYRA